MQAKLGPAGELSTLLIRRAQPPIEQTAPLGWKLRNTLRRSFLLGWLFNRLAKLFSRLTGVPTITSELRAKLIRGSGEVIDYGVVSYRVITDNGVAFLVDDWDNDATDITTMHFHGCGTGTNAENQTDSALQTESTTALNPNSTRATGTESQPAANQLRTVGTLTFDADAAVTEHGIFSTSGTGTGVLWDRSVFAAINVVGANGDSIQFTYTCTVSANG